MPTTPKKIDIHHHLLAETGYCDTLLRAMDEAQIERTGISGLGEMFHGLFLRQPPTTPPPDNASVAEAVKNHPDRLFGLGFIRLGVDTPELVDELVEQGFRGLKFHIPTAPYDNEKFFPVYERAVKYGLPCLFHTGIVALPKSRPGQGVRSAHMDAIHLEGIAQEFPTLQMILAHLGIQSLMTAITLIRIFPNLYADLTGSIPGWRVHYMPADWRRLLCWEGCCDKILFGTDVHCEEFDSAIFLQEQIFSTTSWSAENLHKVYYGNAARLFGLPAAR